MALYGQLSSIKKTMDEIARTRENVSEKGKNGFQFTKQEIKAMPEHIRKIFRGAGAPQGNVHRGVGARLRNDALALSAKADSLL